MNELLKKGLTVAAAITTAVISQKDSISHSQVAEQLRSPSARTAQEPDFLNNRPQLIRSAEAAENFRTFLPDTRRDPIPSPVPDIIQNVDQLMASSEVTEETPYTAEGITYTLKMRRIKGMRHFMDIKDAYKNDLALTIYFDGRARGFKTLEFFIVTSPDHIPPEISTRETGIFSSDDPNDTTGGMSIGRIGVWRPTQGDRIYLLWLIQNLSPATAGQLDRANLSMSDRLASVSASGGNLDGSYQGRPDWLRFVQDRVLTTNLP